jgi:hypothetical protein
MYSVRGRKSPRLSSPIKTNSNFDFFFSRRPGSIELNVVLVVVKTLWPTRTAVMGSSLFLHINYICARLSHKIWSLWPSRNDASRRPIGKYYCVSSSFDLWGPRVCVCKKRKKKKSSKRGDRQDTQRRVVPIRMLKHLMGPCLNSISAIYRRTPFIPPAFETVK